jgi:pyruvate dehydrogenase E1 component alpha subunit
MAAVNSLALPRVSRLSAEKPDPDAGLAQKALYYMSLMREVEDRIFRKLYRQGKIVGGVYTGRGQEAISVGAGLTADPQDVLFPCHRDMALFFIRGFHPREILAQYMGRVGGVTHGKDGNMHMGDIRKRIVAIISSLATSLPVAAGAALALKYQGSRNCAYVIFGDGSTSRGDWHEGVNLAAVQKLPLVLICNNNAYAYSTPIEKQMACANVADRGPAYGIPSEIVEGNDVFAVYRAVGRARAHVLAGLGPYMVECKTFRMTGHAAHDPADYVPKHLWEEWAQKDPIQLLERLMLAKGFATPEEIASTHARILEEVDEAQAWAEQSPFPDPSDLLKGVYEER